MTNQRTNWKSWNIDELTTLIRMHAQGKTNLEIYPHIPTRTPSAIDCKMEAMGLKRNLIPMGITTKPVVLEKPKTNSWQIKVKFEDVSRETIEREWPTGKYWSWQHLRKTHNPIGNMWAEMVR